MTNRTQLILVTICLALIGTVDYLSNYATTCADCSYVINELSNRIVSGESSAPFAYRLLTPYLQHWLGGEFTALVLFHFVGRVLLFNLTYAWVKQMGGHGYLAICLLYVAMSVTYRAWNDSDYAITELVLLLLGWMILFSKLSPVKLSLYLVLIIIGTLNREMTGFLLLLSWCLVHGLSHWRVTLLYSIVALGMILGFRVLIDVENPYTVQRVLSMNLEAWRIPQAVFYNLLLVPVWGILISNKRSMPPAYQRLMIAIVPYMGLLSILALWNEVRLLLPIVVLLLPRIKQE